MSELRQSAQRTVRRCGDLLVCLLILDGWIAFIKFVRKLRPAPSVLDPHRNLPFRRVSSSVEVKYSPKPLTTLIRGTDPSLTPEESAFFLQGFHRNWPKDKGMCKSEHTIDKLGRRIQFTSRHLSTYYPIDVHGGEWEMYSYGGYHY